MAQRELDARDFDGSAWWPVLALAREVAQYKQTWQANLTAVKARGEDPRLSGSVKESFAHYAAAMKMLTTAVAVSFTGSVARRDRAARDLISQVDQG